MVRDRHSRWQVPSVKMEGDLGDLGLVANELVNPWILEQINYR